MKAEMRVSMQWVVAAVLVTAATTLFFPPRAAAELRLCASLGSGAGQCSAPRGVATDFKSGRVYVADRNNNRVDVFEADGEFVMAFGWGVADGTTNAPQTCTTTCFKGIAGAGAGQFEGPTRIAVDNVPGSPTLQEIYVGSDNFRVQRFKPTGEFVSAFGWGVDTGAEKLESCTSGSGCQAGIAGPGECQISQSTSPIAVGPGGKVFLADTSGKEPNFIDRVESFSAGGACLGEVILLQGNFRLKALAVDAAEDAFVAVERAEGGLSKYDLGAAETKLCAVDAGIETNALGLDGEGHLFASQLEQRVKPKPVLGAFQVISEYDDSCKILRRFGYGKLHSNLAGVAFLHSGEGDIFGSEENSGEIPYIPIPPAGSIVAPESLEAPEATIGNAKARVRAEINPEGKETSVHVEYVDDAHFKEGGLGFESPARRSTEAQPIGAGFRLQGIEPLLGCPVASKVLIEEGKCLTPETEYHWRVIAKNADNPSGGGEGTVVGPTFKTKKPLEIEDTWASEVGPDAATLNAVVNPLGIPASAYFEYVDDATYQLDKGSSDGFQHALKVPNPEPPAEEAEINFGSGEAGAKRSVLLSPLKAATTYHYRLSAIDPLIEARQLSEAKTLRTFAPEGPEGGCPGNEALRTGAGALLPDCRAYEMVSPLDKAGGDIVVGGQATTGQPAVVSESAVSGGRLTYGSYRPFGDAKSGAPTTQYIATRRPPGDPEEGWRTHAITPAADSRIAGEVQSDFEFKAFSEDLCEGWIAPQFEPTLAAGAIAGKFNLYRRQDGLCGEEGYEALTTAKPLNESFLYTLELQGLSDDGSVAAFGATEALEGSGAPANPGHKTQLYIKGPGQGPRFACILPGGAVSGECTAGSTIAPVEFSLNRSANVTNALSADGKRVFWTNAGSEGPIYVRENPLGEGPECGEAVSPCTLAVSEAGEEETGGEGIRSHFWTAAKDGSRAIFASANKAGKANLYEFAVNTKETEKIAGGFLGFLGASEDATHVYFASSEVLTPGEENNFGEEAEAGKANLYLHLAGVGAGSFKFIAVLAGADVGQGAGAKGGSSATAPQPEFHNGRVSGDGLAAAFMSVAPLSGYENTDAGSPAPCGSAKGICDTEVFVYEAGAGGGAGELLCVSCNPSNGRPAGANVGGVGRPPFWVAGRMPVLQSTLYGGRELAEAGNRLYFESHDALVARDTNSRFDVYQWERAGTGSCDKEKPSFSTGAGGCVQLISSGQSTSDSGFIDASPNGADVFFTTLSGLVPQDYGLIDIYDARIGGGFEPPPPPPIECEAEECQHPPAAAEFKTPASANPGPANLTPKAPKCAKGKHRVKRGGKSQCVKKKKASGQKRANQSRRAGR